MATFILVLKKATNEIAQIPEPGGSKQSNEMFPLSSASTFFIKYFNALVTAELSPTLEDHLTISQYDFLHLHKNLSFKNFAVPVLKI